MKFLSRLAAQGAVAASLFLSVIAGSLLAWSPSTLAQSNPRPYVLVTDVDDTIKVSHITNPVNKVVRFLSRPVAFAGMATLYRHLVDDAQARGQSASFITVSGTPQLFESSVWSFLDRFQFPAPLHVMTRPFLADTEDFKADVISTLISHPALDGATVVLVGDDTEHDESAYRRAIAPIPGEMGFDSQIYIRRVRGTAQTGANLIAFDSAADIAIAEFMKGKLQRASVEEVFSEIENEPNVTKLFVPGEYCPDLNSPRLSSALPVSAAADPLVARFVKIEDHLRKKCSI